MQITGIDADLKNSLWNLIYRQFCENLHRIEKSGSTYELHHINEIQSFIWTDFFKREVDRQPYGSQNFIETIRSFFYECEWNKIYELIEFCANIESRIINISTFELEFNKVAEREFSPYRLISRIISPISNDSEIKEIKSAIENSNEFTSLQGCNIHLTAALRKLSDRENPDYRNSIKESISAVESIAKTISEEDSKSLKPALDKIKKPLGLHQALVTAFGSLYGYTSDEGGIRHAMMETNTSDFEDAKYMLVSCSAFINYLIAKCAKAGIALS